VQIPLWIEAKPKGTFKGLLFCSTSIMGMNALACISFALLITILSPIQAGGQISGSDSTACLRFAGDCLLAGYYESSVGNDAAYAFDEFDLLRNADVAMVNLECPITSRGKKVPKPYNFRMQPEFIAGLQRGGIDIVNLANNHVYDYGSVGLFDTISYLDSVGICHVGAGRNSREAHQPAVITVSRRRIGFLGYYGGGEAPEATEKKPGVARPEIRLITSDIESLRHRDSVQFIVVNLHWGTEKARIPDQWQVQLGHHIIDAGADVVIGHHPHVLQGIERYKTGVIVYSLGNFIFGGNSRSSYDTGVFEIRLTGNSTSYKFIPVRITNWKAQELQGEDAKSILRHMSYVSGKFQRSLFSMEETR